MGCRVTTAQPPRRRQNKKPDDSGAQLLMACMTAGLGGQALGSFLAPSPALAPVAPAAPTVTPVIGIRG